MAKTGKLRFCKRCGYKQSCKPCRTKLAAYIANTQRSLEQSGNIKSAPAPATPAPLSPPQASLPQAQADLPPWATPPPYHPGTTLQLLPHHLTTYLYIRAQRDRLEQELRDQGLLE